MGGSWESLVKSVKVALSVVLKERAPREEVLRTFLAEVEHSVNSRPLTHVSVDPRDPEALTPNRFLIGGSSGAVTPGAVLDEDVCLRKQWRIAQALANMFWNRWIREYLPTLLTRKRWQRNDELIKKGDIVVVMDHTLPRNAWPKGTIEETYPGKDSLVRVVDIRTSRGIMRRHVRKVVKLPVKAPTVVPV